ncbi:MAG TPA: hypothetical protein VD930_09350 [Gemmatimonadales bacterium]|nr:hypothetical protein [Gemmatimonadales bacterium]
MQHMIVGRHARRLAGLLAIAAGTAGCASTLDPTRVSPGATLLYSTDPAFAADRQCRGRYTQADLARYLPRARLAMSLPGTRSVAVDNERRCITVNVETVGSGRLAELVMRGVAVPRRAILLRLVS